MMRKNLLLAGVFSLWLVPNAALAAEKSVMLNVENMTCASCPYIVKESLQVVPGVKSVEVVLETNSAIVTYDDAVTSLEVLTKATTDAGFPSQVKS